jgi:hypothetical protein
MVFVYVNIYAATRARLRARAAADGRLAAAIVTTTVGLSPADGAGQTAAVNGDEKDDKYTKAENPTAAKTSSVRSKIETNPKPERDEQKRDNASGCSVTIGPSDGINGSLEGKTPSTPSSRKPEVKSALAVGDVIVVGERSHRRFLVRSTSRFRSILRRFNVDDDDDDAGATDDEVGDSPRSNGRRRRQQPPSSASQTPTKSPSKAGSSVRGGDAASQRIWQFLEEKQRITLARERRAARTMGIVMGAFVLCWLPFFVTYVVFAFHPAWKSATDERVYNFIVWLGYVNSTLNPLIYTVFNVDFRRAFSLLLRCRCFRRRRPNK